MEPIHASRPTDASFWLVQATHFLHRYLTRPEEDRLAALLDILGQYRDAVQLGRVKPPRYL